MSAFLALIKFLWNNSSQVLTLLEVLPDALQAAGSAMVIAGGSATSAGTFIRGNGTEGVNLRQLFGGGADIITSIKNKVEDIEEQVDGLTSTFSVPIGDNPLEDVADQISNLKSRLQNLANALDDISSVFNNMGNDLKDVGEQLTNVGNELQQIN
jgi:methyl-accepting chemotaxis protein